MRVVLAQPRGFCAGVERAIEIVERALEKYGPPIYVRHEIVHNRHVVERLRAKGARFVDEIDEVPPGAVTIFSAHGVASAIETRGRRARAAGDRRHLPARLQGAYRGPALRQAGPRDRPDRPCRPSGDRGHDGPDHRPGASGLRPSRRSRDSDGRRPREACLHHPDDAVGRRHPRASSRRCKARFPAIVGPDTKDICYATQNRQRAVRELANRRCGPGRRRANSSNSNRLREIAAELACRAI